MTGAAIVISRIIMCGNVDYSARFDLQIATLQEEGILIRIQFRFRYLGLTTNIDCPAPVVIAEGIIDYFVNLYYFTLDFDLNRRS